MIAFLRGRLAGKTLTEAFIDVNGVGYAVSMSSNSLAVLPEIGEEVLVKTIMSVSDSDVSLFGFTTDEEKSLFEKLITVNSVGPKMALAALSTFAPSALAEAIASEDTSKVSMIPGVGKKKASRIILELKGCFDNGIGGLFAESDDGGSATSSAGAIEALLSMGFTTTEAELALKGAPDEATEQELLRYALKRIGNQG